VYKHDIISMVNSGSVEEGGRSLAQLMVVTWTDCGKQFMDQTKTRDFQAAEDFYCTDLDSAF